MTHIGKLHILENLRGCLNFSFYCKEGEGAVAIPFSEYVCFRWQVTEEGKNYVGIFLLNCMQSRNVRRRVDKIIVFSSLYPHMSLSLDQKTLQYSAPLPTLSSVLASRVEP